ncbi:transposable element Tc1 transposase [Trichonephila clavipes]|nr:transposable element Tc1 transposase [Trichonephila clavipes]
MNPTSIRGLTIIEDVSGDGQDSVSNMLSVLHAPQALNKELWSGHDNANHIPHVLLRPVFQLIKHFLGQPDPSPIEHVWDIMGRRLHLPGNVDDLARQLEQIWQEIPQETIRVFIPLCHAVWMLASRLESVFLKAVELLKTLLQGKDPYWTSLQQKYDACRRQIYRPISKKEQAHHSSAGGKSVSCCLRKADLPKNCCQTFEGGGLYARRPVLCVPLTRQHRTARLQWCREHHNWTEQDWACVLFSDEKNIQEKDRYPTCSIMMWAGIMINGRTRLHVVANGTMTGQRYIDEVLLPHVRLFRGAVGDKFVFMDDNATCHRTLAVQDCLDSEGIQRLVWPAPSPDLNPI